MAADSNVLKDIERELTGGSNTPESSVAETKVEREPESVESVVREKNDTKATVNSAASDDGEDDPIETPKPKTEAKLSRRALAAKEAADTKVRLEQTIAEERKQRLDLESRMKPFLEEQDRIRRQKEQEAALKGAETDPAGFLNQLVESKLQEYLAPMRQKEIETQQKEYYNQSVNTWKTLAGSEEVFEATKPHIRQLLENTLQQQGPQAAELLARNPEAAFRIARDIYNEQNRQQQVTTNQENIQKKQEIAKISASISKPNQMSRTSAGDKKSGTRNEINQFLLNYAGQK